MRVSGTRLGLHCQYCAGFAGCGLSAGRAVELARLLDEDELIEHWTHRSVRNRSRLHARAVSGWRCRGGGLRTRYLVVSKAGRAGPVVRRRAPGACPLARWGALVQARATLPASWSVSAC